MFFLKLISPYCAGSDVSYRRSFIAYLVLFLLLLVAQIIPALYGIKAEIESLMRLNNYACTLARLNVFPLVVLIFALAVLSRGKIEKAPLWTLALFAMSLAWMVVVTFVVWSV